jgi:hypothetical protein
MTPRLRSLFEGTVEPLLDPLRCRSARDASKLMKAERAETMKQSAAVAALAELEGPIVDDLEPGAWGAVAASSSSSSSAAAAAAASASAVDSKLPPAAPKKARPEPSSTGAKATAQGPAASALVSLFLEYTGPAFLVVDFMGGGSALHSVGTAAPALRAVVKAGLTRLGLRVQSEPSPIPLVGLSAPAPAAAPTARDEPRDARPTQLLRASHRQRRLQHAQVGSRIGITVADEGPRIWMARFNLNLVNSH